MVKHTITNNRCYVLVSIEWFYSLRQSFSEKSMAKSRQKTATESPFPSKLWGGVFWGVAESGWKI